MNCALGSKRVVDLRDAYGDICVRWSPGIARVGFLESRGWGALCCADFDGMDGVANAYTRPVIACLSFRFGPERKLKKMGLFFF